MTEYVKILYHLDHCTKGAIYEVIEKFENDLMIKDDFDQEYYVNYKNVKFVENQDDQEKEITEYVKLIKSYLDCTIGKTYEVLEKNLDMAVQVIDDVGDLTWILPNKYEFVYKKDESKVVVEDKITNPFIVTKTFIKSGVYNFMSSGAVLDIEKVDNDKYIIISIGQQCYDKQSLKELIQILTEIEEVMK